MNFCARTDLACESMGKTGKPFSGAEYRESRVGCFRICRLKIRNTSEAEAIGKPMGSYVTVECGQLRRLSDQDCALLSRLLAGELRGMAERLTGRRPDPDFGILVAGLGNAELTADAIGPKTVGLLTATRHLKEHEGKLYRRIGCSALSALAPGVLGQTGIETLELLRGAVTAVRPHMVLTIDALAARSCQRLASTVQISDSGIRPGSGVGNHRAAITSETLGVPVAVLGVPTVVDSATLVYDALQEAGMEKVDSALQRVLENRRSFFVSPKESDVITELVSRILAQAINLAFVGDPI